MSVDLQGIDQLLELSKRLKAEGEKGLQRELSKGIAEAMKPLRLALQRSAAETFPKSGGLAKRVASSKFSTRRNKNGLRLVANGNRTNLARLNRGIVRHPVYGNTEVWVDQPVPLFWWSEPIEKAGPEVTKRVQEALDRVAKRIGAPL